MPARTISYAQRYEDMHLLRAFGEQASGFYIDIGAGHPVYDNVSFAFYLRGWSGITVEPNPWLAQLSKSVRPLDIRVEALIGEEPGTATYYLVEDFHGLSTMIEGQARAAEREFGKRSRAITMPVRTLLSLCKQFAPGTIDFLKIDVEGAERAVLLGGDWRRFRPKIVVAEALAPVTMAPAWETWEPLLLESGYRFALFDSLNRYYVAEEHAHLGARLSAAPPSFTGVTPFGRFKPALDGCPGGLRRRARARDGERAREALLEAFERKLAVARLAAGILRHRAHDRAAAGHDPRLRRSRPPHSCPVPSLAWL